MSIIRLPIILGPTGVGKTEIALQVAEALGGEILSADSRQVYREMNIGTSKPTPEEQRKVKHHMIDLVPPDVHYSSGDYARDAWKVLKSTFDILNSKFEIHNSTSRITNPAPTRGGANHPSPITGLKIPLLVGGSGLYIRAFLNGFFDAPPVNLSLRQRLEKEEKATLYERLKNVDPQAAERIHPNDRQRITRALEVYEQTGYPLTKLQSGIQHPESTIQTLFIGLTREREDLYRRIDKRVERMMEEGFVEEVEGLLANGYSPEMESFKAVGYREILRTLQGEISEEEAVELTKKNTRHFARRQLTWFRGLEGVEWISLQKDSDATNIAKKIGKRISEFLSD